jgi:hypothetical protein
MQAACCCLAGIDSRWPSCAGRVAALASDDEVDFFRAGPAGQSFHHQGSCWRRGVNPNLPIPGRRTGSIIAMREGSMRVARILLDQPGIDLEAPRPTATRR